MTLPRAILVLAALLLGAVPAAAHHSAAVYDHTKQDVAEGTVKEFIYANPHATLVVLLTRGGAEVEMRFEMDGPSNLMRYGVSRTTLVPGDKVVVTYHPRRDDPLVGGAMRIVKSDGTTFQFQLPK